MSSNRTKSSSIRSAGGRPAAELPFVAMAVWLRLGAPSLEQVTGTCPASKCPNNHNSLSTTTSLHFTPPSPSKRASSSPTSPVRPPISRHLPPSQILGPSTGESAQDGLLGYLVSSYAHATRQLPLAKARTDTPISRIVNLVVGVLMILGGIGQFWPSFSV